MVKVTSKIGDNGNRTGDETEAWTTRADRDQTRQRLRRLSARAIRAFNHDDAPVPGTHYSEKTGHQARGLAAKSGLTPGQQEDSVGVPVSDVSQIWNPLDSGYTSRGDAAFANSDDAEVANLADGGNDQITQSRGSTHERRIRRDKPDTRPPPTRGRR